MTDQPASAPQRGTGLAFVEHWDWVAEKGLMPLPTARAYQTAAYQILKIDPDWENIDVRTLDVDGLIARFRNLSKLAPGSLATYESRFRSGLASYLAYLDNPASYQPRTRKATQRDEKQPSKQKSPIPPEPNAGEPGLTAAVHMAAGIAKLVVYPFPVRPGVFAELKLPADLTADEALRMGAFLKAVAVDDGNGSA